jgi:hypothetical protein
MLLVSLSPRLYVPEEQASVDMWNFSRIIGSDSRFHATEYSSCDKHQGK